MSEIFWRIYAIVGLIWLAVHIVIFMIALLVLRKDELGPLEEVYSKPLHTVAYVFMDALLWPISIPIKLPRMAKSGFGLVKNVLIYVKFSIKEFIDNQNGSKKGEK